MRRTTKDVKKGGYILENVNNVYITKEVADKLGINPSYLIRVAKSLKEQGLILNDDMRSAGSRNYIFNENAVKNIKKQLEKNKR